MIIYLPAGIFFLFLFPISSFKKIIQVIHKHILALRNSAKVTVCLTLYLVSYLIPPSVSPFLS